MKYNIVIRTTVAFSMDQEKESITFTNHVADICPRNLDTPHSGLKHEINKREITKRTLAGPQSSYQKFFDLVPRQDTAACQA